MAAISRDNLGPVFADWSHANFFLILFFLAFFTTCCNVQLVKQQVALHMSRTLHYLKSASEYTLKSRSKRALLRDSGALLGESSSGKKNLLNE